MQKIFEKFEWIRQYLSHDIWVRMSLVGSRKIHIMQVLYLSALRFIRVRCTVCASSLTTVTMISIVPVLAFFFSVAKGFGGYQKLHSEVIVPGVEQLFGASDAPELRKAIDYLLFFVEETDLSNLGFVGLITIGYALIRLLGAVETTFNDLWNISNDRPFIRKISDYLTVSVVVPVVLFLTASLSTVAKSNSLSMYFAERLSWWGGGALIELLAFPVLWCTFSFAYYFLPNTRVQYKAAFLGGIIGGSLWMLFHYIHILLQLGVANYNALYAGFSAFPIFMIWVFFSWVAVLVGASCAAAVQTRESYRDYVIRENLSVRDLEWVSFRVCFALTEAFVEGRPCVTKEDFEQRVQENPVAIRMVLRDLKREGIAEETKESGAVLLCDPSQISLFRVLDCVKGKGFVVEGGSSSPELQHAKQEILKRIRSEKKISLQEEKGIWLDSASLHLQEKGLIERLEKQQLRASARLLIYDRLRSIQKEIEASTRQHSLLSLYESITADTLEETTTLREIQ